MNTPGLPVQPAVSTPPPQATTPGASQPASTDFLLMLAQLLGVPAPQAGNSTAQSSALMQASGNTGDLTDAEATDAEELSALLGLSLPTTPLVIQTAIAAANSTASAALAKIAAGALQSRSSAVVLEAQLLTELIRSGESGTRESPTALDVMQSPAIATESSQAARPASGHEAMLSRPVHSPVGSAAWADEIGSRLTMMAGQGKHSASLRLSPEHLGPLEIRIAIRDDQASVWFGAAHADTRAAIEHALPRLRELFESQGLSLADAGVFREPPREQSAAVAQSTVNTAESNIDESVTEMAIGGHLGLVDAYA